jgi:dihydroxyacetone kinase-like predicted kinase
VDGGPTQNPSTADLVTAIETVASSDVIILSNHKNIYPVAAQAAEMTPKNVTVLRTGSAVEGLSALLVYMDDALAEENIGRMEEAFGHIKTGEVALASRSTIQGGVEVLSGDSIGIFKGKIQVSCARAEDAALGLVEAMIGPYDEIITLYYGESIQKEEAEALQSALKRCNEGIEIELYYGGQPYAHYIISAE